MAAKVQESMVGFGQVGVAAAAASAEAGAAAVLKALQGLRFGSVEVVVHNGRIVQVERREKVRVEVG